MQTRVQFAQIQSYQPAADFRKSGTIGVLAGRNFAWDAAGVKADFSTRLIAADSSLGAAGFAANELRIAENFHVAVADAVFKFVPSAAGNPTGTWDQVATLTKVQEANLNNVPAQYRGFTSTFSTNAYVCGWNFGVYRVNPDTDTYTRLTDSNTSGFPEDSEPVIAITITNGRQLYLTEGTLYFSNTNAPEDLVPALGGAGFQILNEHIGGEARAIVPISTGAIIWTTEGALIVEYVGGDSVFRYYTIAIEVLPLSQSAITTLPDGTHIALARMGLYHVKAAQAPEMVAPLFSEFLREYLRTRPLEVAHLWYTQADNRIFLSIKSDDGIFYETFCLDVGLDRWGILNDLHLGMFHYTQPRGAFAYINPQGIAAYFLPGRSPNKDKENPFEPGTFTGLGSFITLGYIRSEQLAEMADTVQELQEVVILRSNQLEGLDDEVIDEGNFAALSPDEFDEGLITDVDPSTFDEGLIETVPPPTDYRLAIETDLFTEPEYAFQDAYLAHQGRLSDTWTCMLSGYHFKLKFSADEVGEFFRINAGDCTLASAGQMV